PLHIYTKRLLAAIPRTDVEGRDKNRQKRQALEERYNARKAEYYDENGRVYPLEQVTKTHLVALKKE
ncbi:MAG: ABC transporter ATP-binding protein, partial [Ligilactobacillus sp.]|nr:ABC transporter ATP-binding protein [Ligilactobacillus sp.]